ncbi:pentapeptide repeat-containing protein [Pseudoalteromonas sp. CO109Y]|uniref:pentapeptide repeat-containing protein n=1 Tax=Pseudoalteromonas sp. CO109Y TaxID=1777235 RepID=UPI001022AC5B|nr:pentapeptide repeat-containing protein [Pseudoalteromonas sp. CO109Y]RZF87855.1 pentapeptide repeat-containing protein [Pseudoalteromonas sp. CO109Y]
MHLPKPIKRREFVNQHLGAANRLVRIIFSPIFSLEWCLRYLAYLMSHSGLVGVLEYTGKLTILVTAVIWVTEIDDRKLDRLRKAWSTYLDKNFREFDPNVQPENGSAGTASIVWKGAVRDLIDNKVYLDGADMRGAIIEELDARNGRFFLANFNGAIMDRSNFENAYLGQAKMIHTDLVEVNFKGATLSEADLTDSYLVEANFTNAFLGKAKFVNAMFMDAVLTNADIDGADFTGAKSLTCVQLKQARNLETAILPEELLKCLPSHDKSSKKDARIARVSP